jgi:hypothetical protein
MAAKKKVATPKKATAAQVEAMLVELLKGVDDNHYYDDMCDKGQKLIDKANKLINRERRFTVRVSGTVDVAAKNYDDAVKKLEKSSLTLEGTTVKLGDVDCEDYNGDSW